MVYSAVFIAYLLLSSFEIVDEKERMAVELVVDLAASYDLDLGRIDMTRDIFGKARILLPQLCAIAARHGHHSTGSEVGFNQIYFLLLGIVKALVGHLCPYEHREVRVTFSDAQELLDLPLDQLRASIQIWCSKNFEMVLQTTSLPRGNVASAKSLAGKHTRVARIRDPRSKRYGWNPTRTENQKVGPTAGGKAGDVRPWWVDRPLATLGIRSTNVSREELARREWPQSPVYSPLSSTSSGPSTPDAKCNYSENWNRAGGLCWGEPASSVPGALERDGPGRVEHKLASQMRRGLKAMFSS